VPYQAAVPTDLLGRTDLLRSIDAEKRSAVLRCLSARYRSFNNGQVISFLNDENLTFRIILDGAALLVRYDLRGNRAIMAELKQGALIDVSALERDRLLSDTELVARKSCRTIDFLIPDRKRKKAVCCKYIDKVEENVRELLLATNERLVLHILILSGRTIKERIILFLQEERMLSGANSFAIPYNRQELADLLNADRSALSRELGQMQAEGLISFDGNRFSLNLL